MEKKATAGQALKQFIADFRIPDQLVCNGVAEQVGKKTEFRNIVRKHDVYLDVTEPHCHNQSKVEDIIHEIWKQWFQAMLKKHVPKRLWDYGICWVCELMQ